MTHVLLDAPALIVARREVDTSLFNVTLSLPSQPSASLAMQRMQSFAHAGIVATQLLCSETATFARKSVSLRASVGASTAHGTPAQTANGWATNDSNGYLVQGNVPTALVY